MSLELLTCVRFKRESYHGKPLGRGPEGQKVSLQLPLHSLARLRSLIH